MLRGSTRIKKIKRKNLLEEKRRRSSSEVELVGGSR